MFGKSPGRGLENESVDESANYISEKLSAHDVESPPSSCRSHLTTGNRHRQYQYQLTLLFVLCGRHAGWQSGTLILRSLTKDRLLGSKSLAPLELVVMYLPRPVELSEDSSPA